MTDYVDYIAAEERLLSITTDPAIIARLTSLRQAGKPAQVCLGAFRDAGISLDFVLFDAGKPALPKPKSKSPSP